MILAGMSHNRQQQIGIHVAITVTGQTCFHMFSPQEVCMEKPRQEMIRGIHQSPPVSAAIVAGPANAVLH